MHIFSFAVNTKFPIDTQYRQFKKYCLDDNFAFTLFNDAVDQVSCNEINNICQIHQVPNVRVPQEIHLIQNPSEGYASTLNWAVKKYAVENNCDTILLIHSDVFPIEQVSIKNMLEDNMVASVMETRILNGRQYDYFYPALTIINVKELGDKIQELDFGCSLGLDTGGKTHKFIENNSDMKIKHLTNHQIPNIINSLSPGLQEYLIADMEICHRYGLNKGWVCDNLYHYLAGSQWNALDLDKKQGHTDRMNLFLKYFY